MTFPNKPEKGPTEAELLEELAEIFSRPPEHEFERAETKPMEAVVAHHPEIAMALHIVLAVSRIQSEIILEVGRYEDADVRKVVLRYILGSAVSQGELFGFTKEQAIQMCEYILTVISGRSSQVYDSIKVTFVEVGIVDAVTKQVDHDKLAAFIKRD